MSYTRAVGIALLVILSSTFWKGSDGCAVNISVTGAPVISVSEKESSVTIKLTRVNTTSDVTLTVIPHIVSVINGSDVILSNKMVTFPDGQNSVSTSISIVSDQSLENTESFFIQLVSSDQDVCFVNNNVTVQIINDDKVTVGFSEPIIYVREDATLVPFKFTLTGHTLIPVTVGYMTTGVGNASTVTDYKSELVPSLHTFPSGAINGSVNVAGLLKNDDVLEGTKCFQVKLTKTQADVILSPETAMVCVTNDDKVELNFLYSNMTVEESKGFISIPVNKTGRSTVPLSYRLKMDDKTYSTAIRGDDYQDRHGNIITFPASDQELSTMHVNVSIKMDGKAESSEIFVVGLEAVDSSTTMIGSQKSMVVKITDQKDNDDYAAREVKREQDEKERTDNLLLILYISVAFVALIVIILIIICVLIIKKLKIKENP